MTKMETFEQRLEDILRQAEHEPGVRPDEIQRYMAEFSKRREHFVQLASRLVNEIIRPRIEAVARRFRNTKVQYADGVFQCACWFGYSERFPVTASVLIGVEHDAKIESLVLHIQANMMPVFVHYRAESNLSIGLSEFQDDVLIDWLDERLLDWVSDYLQIDRGDETGDEDIATDPVCGMRILRSRAEASAEYLGHAYFFCSQRCHDAFTTQPTDFVRFKTHY